jgi:hypothetical protein
MPDRKNLAWPRYDYQNIRPQAQRRVAVMEPDAGSITPEEAGALFTEER